MRRSSMLCASVAAAGTALAARQVLAPGQDTDRSAGHVAVTVPVLSGAAGRGQPLFDANCARCHGPYGSGSDTGPPLVHKIYEPGHHADAAFHSAIRYGVRAHHWRFGDMPAMPGLSETDVRAIIAFVRTVQRANGIN